MVFSRGDNRKWTDRQLLEAVSNNRSWASVLRGLGLNATSTGSKRAIQRRVQELGLSTEHFSGRRQWNDRMLRDAVKGARTWPELVEKLGLTSTSANSRAAVRARCLKLGIPLDHLGLRRPNQSAPAMVQAAPAIKAELRYAAPNIVAAWFQLRGYKVSVPAEHAPYDLIVDLPEGLTKVQVKTSTRRDRYGSYQVAVAPRRTHGPNRYVSVPYDPSDVDMFGIVDGSGSMYLIPMGAVAGAATVSLNAYQRFRCGSASSLLGAELGSGVIEAA